MLLTVHSRFHFIDCNHLFEFVWFRLSSTSISWNAYSSGLACQDPIESVDTKKKKKRIDGRGWDMNTVALSGDVIMVILAVRLVTTLRENCRHRNGHPKPADSVWAI